MRSVGSHSTVWWKPVLMAGLVTVLLLAACAPVARPSSAQKLSIGSTHNEADMLLYIAQDQGLFDANGLAVTIKDYSSGAAAVDGMLKGEVDMATASEFGLAQSAFAGEAIQTVGTICKSQNVYLLGRTDRGIRSVSDLKGKKVGIPRQTAAQFYFGRFLDLHGMSEMQMTLVDTDIAQSVNVIMNGEVDAVQTWEPYVSTLKEKLGDKLVIWPAQSEQPLYKNLVAQSAWLAQHPDTVMRVLQSLAQAESNIVHDPDKAKAMIQKRLEYSDGYMEAVWPLNQSSLALDQSLVIAMEDEARWMIRHGVVNGKQMPDFMASIYMAGLASVKPESVNIIH